MEEPAKPIIDFASQTASNVQKAVSPDAGIKGPFPRNLTKIIFGVLGLIILIELIIGFRTLTAGRTQPVLPPQIASMSDPKIVIRPSRTDVSIGETVEVKVLVVTGGNSTDSTDLILHYDPKFLEASVSSSIKVGQIYEDFPVAVVDPGLGEIAVSGVTPPKGQPFVGIGTLATLYFKALQNGKSALTVDFQKGATAESNVVLSGSSKDILGEVINVDISIGTSGGTQPPPSSCQGYTQYCQTPEGKTGRQLCSPGKKVGLSCVFDPMLSISCEPCSAK